MKIIFKTLGKYWPILALLVIEVILFSANYTPHTFVVGWDNMYPELNFGLNLKRAFFGIWQEYRGLGLEDGLSHIAELPHYLFLWLLSLAIPQNLLRYTFIFLMHFVGGVGMYWLLKNHIFAKHHSIAIQPIALAGALFYQFNFATIQMFYLPFEVFMVHFAALPWLIYAALRYLDAGAKKYLWLFAIFSLISTPQAHVPTVFLVYAMTLGIILITHMLTFRSRIAVQRSLIIIFITFMVNAFWGLPFTHTTITHASDIANSKNNQMATDDIYLKNQKYGDLMDTALMRSFSLDYVQYDYTTHSQNNMFTAWKTHIDKPTISIISGVFFALAVVGVALILIRQKKEGYPFVLLFVFAFLVIGNNIPILSRFSETLQTIIPLFHNVFRFVFTKFFTLYAFSYAILIAYTLYEIVHSTSHAIKRDTIIIVSFFVVILTIYTLPSFQGNFFFKNLRVAIPQEYFETFNFLSQQNPSERVLVLPAPWFWAWTQYNWDVIGSGFEWFGIPQPIVDRAFDPWSRTDENLYWELSQAIFTKNPSRFEEILKKYNITWVLYDKNIINGDYERSLYSDVITQSLESLKQISPPQTFGNISLYNYQTDNPDKTSITSYDGLPNIGPQYAWNDYDAPLRDVSIYKTDTHTPYDIYYPFRSLFTGRSQKELTFTIEDQQNDYRINTLVQGISSGQQLVTPAFDPQILTDIDSKTGKLIAPPEPLAVLLNSEIIATIGAKPEITELNTTSPSILTLQIPKIKNYQYYDSDLTSDFSQTPKSCDGYNTGVFSRHSGVDNQQKYLRFTSVGSSNCISFGLSSFSQKEGYLVQVNTRHIEGKYLSISIVNNDTRRAFLETQIDTPADSSAFVPSYFVIPPMDPYGLGYTITIDNVAIGSQKTINDLARVSVYQLSYAILSDLKIQQSNTVSTSSASTSELSVSHPNPAYYKVVIGNNGSPIRSGMTNTLILSQSFDNGWKAYSINNPIIQYTNNPIIKWIGESLPFVFGTEFTNHVLVNNWENGWELPEAEVHGSKFIVQGNTNQPSTMNNEPITIILFFWPQLLEYLGFLLLPIPFIYVWRLKYVEKH